MKTSTLRYWLFQIAGWGGWMMLNVFFAYFFSQEYFQGERGKIFISILLIQLFWYILATHLLRLVLHQISWIQLPMNKIIPVFLIGVMATGVLAYYGSKFTAQATNNSLVAFEKQMALKRALALEKESSLPHEYYKKVTGTTPDSVVTEVAKIKQSTGWQRDRSGKWRYEDPRAGRFWWDIIFTLILMALWLAIYTAWHFLIKSQKDKLDKVHLEKTVKELELKTIKSHINPHFIFNSLNSIRALVEENPRRARTAITELSNLLRSSLQTEKHETIPLEQELNIVQNYLALEQMRFEERLQVNFEIDEDTLRQPIPPMMLQTLVENAIKHGIGKKVQGGTINIISRQSGGKFEIIVQNTGTMEEESEGFGITSTRSRLNILHNGQSAFNISNVDDDMVEAKVTMPVVK